VQPITKPFAYSALDSKVRSILTAPARPGIRLAEDEPLIRRPAVEELKLLCFKIETAASVAQAMSKLKLIGEVEAAIIDIGLPDRKGDVLVCGVWEVYPSTPVVIATGYVEAALRQCFKSDDRGACFAACYREPNALKRRPLTGGLSDVCLQRRPTEQIVFARNEVGITLGPSMKASAIAIHVRGWRFDVFDRPRMCRALARRYSLRLFAPSGFRALARAAFRRRDLGGVAPAHRGAAFAPPACADMRLAFSRLLIGLALRLFTLRAPQVSSVLAFALVLRSASFLQRNRNRLSTAFHFAALTTAAAL
jgi:CheY-like chemotaxis protein